MIEMAKVLWKVRFLEPSRNKLWSAVLVACLMVLPNIFPYSLSQSFAVFRPFFNFDYLLVVCLLHFRCYRLALVACVGIYSVDCLVVVAQVFPIFKFSDVIYLGGFSLHSGSSGLLMIFVVLLGLSASYWLLAIGVKSIPKNIFQLMVLIQLFVFLLVLTMDENNKVSWRMEGIGVFGSQSYAYFLTRQHGFHQQMRSDGGVLKTSDQLVSAFYSSILADARAGENVLLVIAESLGVVEDDLRELLYLPLIKSENVDDIKYGEIQFKGVTLQGELRELCSAVSSGINIAAIKEGFDLCLPKLLSTQGYRTEAFHGASGSMYGRKDWYPRAGFHKVRFLENSNWERGCSSFPGACDDVVAKAVLESANDIGPAFLYWLTLSAHFPYYPSDVIYDLVSCAALGVPEGSVSCRNLKLQAQLFYIIANMVDGEALSGYKVYIVGDHQPVLLNQDEQGRYFKMDHVPWISFKVK